MVDDTRHPQALDDNEHRAEGQLKLAVPTDLHLLVAAKDESYTESIVRMAASILRSTGGMATLLMVVPDPSRRQNAEAVLKKLEATLAPNPARLLVRVGKASEEIGRESASGEYDLLVVGKRPKKGLFKRLFPHTAEQVIKEMSCPVLIAREHAGPLRRILVCEGGQSVKLLPAITGRLKPLMQKAEKIVLLHVMSQITAMPGVRGWELRADAEELIGQHTPEGERLEYDLSALTSLGVHVTVKVRHGVVVEEILAEAEEGNYDVIVLGTPQVTGFQRYLVDDPIHKIMMLGKCPVLVV